MFKNAKILKEKRLKIYPNIVRISDHSKYHSKLSNLLAVFDNATFEIFYLCIISYASEFVFHIPGVTITL